MYFAHASVIWTGLEGALSAPLSDSWGGLRPGLESSDSLTSLEADAERPRQLGAKVTGGLGGSAFSMRCLCAVSPAHPKLFKLLLSLLNMTLL